jgi:hypothetical protein
VVVEIVAVEVSTVAVLAAVTTVIAVVMAVVNITDINQPRCNTKGALIESAFFYVPTYYTEPIILPSAINSRKLD